MGFIAMRNLRLEIRDVRLVCRTLRIDQLLTTGTVGPEKVLSDSKNHSLGKNKRASTAEDGSIDK